MRLDGSEPYTPIHFAACSPLDSELTEECFPEARLPQIWPTIPDRVDSAHQSINLGFIMGCARRNRRPVGPW